MYLKLLSIGFLLLQGSTVLKAAALPTTLAHSANYISQIVRTTSGHYIGHSDLKHPDITEYLGIRYGQPATGDLRFAAPIAYASQETFHASTQPYDCPYVADPWGIVPNQSWSHSDRIMAQESADGYNAMSEDCLALNIWTTSKTIDAGKPVMVFLYGGGFQRGSINNPAYNGAGMASNEDVVVVTFNYRVNIVGFSGALGVPPNVGLLDVRLAMEWIRDNIDQFGGDPQHITMFGQSQGAYLISYYAYAYPNDTIASSFIQESGSAFSPTLQTLDEKAELWYEAARNVGCDQNLSESVLDCMRQQDLSTVLAAWASLPASTITSPGFGPVIDHELIFSNYTERTLSGEFATKPFLLGSNANEAGFYVLRYANKTAPGITINQTVQDEIGFGLYFCPIAFDAEIKAAALASARIPVYRYEYFGDFPNLRLFPSSGAYHTSETSVVFGTMKELSGDANTEREVEVSRYMQRAWTTFARDPMHGLEALGWPGYNPEGETLIRLGYEKEVEASFASPYPYDEVCRELAKAGTGA